MYGQPGGPAHGIPAGSAGQKNLTQGLPPQKACVRGIFVSAGRQGAARQPGSRQSVFTKQRKITGLRRKGKKPCRTHIGQCKGRAPGRLLQKRQQRGRDLPGQIRSGHRSGKKGRVRHFGRAGALQHGTALAVGIQGIAAQRFGARFGCFAAQQGARTQKPGTAQRKTAAAENSGVPGGECLHIPEHRAHRGRG